MSVTNWSHMYISWGPFAVSGGTASAQPSAPALMKKLWQHEHLDPWYSFRAIECLTFETWTWTSSAPNPEESARQLWLRNAEINCVPGPDTLSVSVPLHSKPTSPVLPPQLPRGQYSTFIYDLFLVSSVSLRLCCHSLFCSLDLAAHPLNLKS